MSYDPCRVYRKLARNNLLANMRLHDACLRLSQEELVAPRTSFFTTIRATLNHIHIVDVFYFDALKGGTLGFVAFVEREPYLDMISLRTAQEKLDREFVAFVDGLGTVELAAIAEVRRPGRIQRDRCDDILIHLSQHQTHHRGQVHSMLSGTSIKPPQLDEFIVRDDASVRKTEMDTLGWSEDDLMLPDPTHD